MALKRYVGTGATLADRWKKVSGSRKITVEDNVHPAGTNAVNGKAVAKFVTIQTTAPTAPITDGGFHIVLLSQDVKETTTMQSGYTYFFYKE